MHEHMVFGSGLTDALDYPVLLHCMFLAAAQRPFTVADVLASLRSEGILASNGSGLVGRDAVRGSFRRLEAAGFIRRSQPNEKGGFGKVEYELFLHPGYNPDWSGTTRPGTMFPQVTPGTAVPSAVRPADMGKAAGHTADGITGAGNGGAGDAVPGQLDKTAGHTADGIAVPGSGPPPTPPLSREEEDSSSLKGSSTAAGGVPGLDEAAVRKAGEFLALLPGRWACGRKTAARLAPLLAEAVAVQGWSLGPALVAQLTRRTRGKVDAAGVLQERIEDLPLYLASRAPVPGETRDRSMAVGQQLPLDGATGRPGEAPVGASAPPKPVGAGCDVSDEQVAQARSLLLSLTAPWHVGPTDADRLAPLLASTALERGWSFGEELRQQLMSNPGGGSNYLWLLEHKRIAALPLRTRKPAGARPAAPAGMCARHPGFREVDCGPCIKAARRAARAAAVLPGADTAPAPAEGAGQEAGPGEPGEFGVPTDVVAYVKGLQAGAAADAARGERPRLTAAQRRRVAEEQEQTRRHEAHNAALNA
ncbi:hypothetical protein OG985_48680 (plasmid) [Streptomyces sp. NBC_00289]|uniref:hypothetical protein n=1 Tax=Streptomyces sp. NBC_00289 TaxID=2975703 RepID=UPI00324C9A0E